MLEVVPELVVLEEVDSDLELEEDVFEEVDSGLEEDEPEAVLSGLLSVSLEVSLSGLLPVSLSEPLSVADSPEAVSDSVVLLSTSEEGSLESGMTISTAEPPVSR